MSTPHALVDADPLPRDASLDHLVLTPSTRTDLALSTLLCVLLFAAVFMLGWWFGDLMSVSGDVR